MSHAVEPRFDQDRKDWATSADPLADRCYQELWDICESDIYDLESLVDGVHDRAGGYETHQILDYGGVDRIIDLGDRHVYLAQRFRPNSGRLTDLSLRVDCGVSDRSPELDKWLAAYESRGFFPSVIAFGVFDSVIQAFSEFHLIDTETVLDAYAAGTLQHDRHATGDGTAAIYVRTDELSKHEAILRSWDGVAPEPNTTEA